MSMRIRASARTLFHPFSRLRSLEERVGLTVFVLALLFVMTHPAPAHEFKLGELELVHPWSRETPAGARVAAGYVTIVNRGTEADRLIGVSGAIAGRGEVHEMAVNAQGVMTMRPVEGIEIPAGGTVELKPGGFHIMFLDLQGAPRQGETFAGSLTFEKAGIVDVEFAVEAMGGAQGHGGHGESAGQGSGHGGHGGHGG